MLVALVWAETIPLKDITVRFERYVRGFEALGHEVVTVCLGAAATDYPFRVHVAPGPTALDDPEFWRPLGLDLAVIIVWLRRGTLVDAIKASCPWVVSISDSDGILGARVYPSTVFARMVAFHSDWREKAGAARHWLKLATGGYRHVDYEVLVSCQAADRITVTTPGARDNLIRFFRWHGRGDLCAKVSVVPYPVDSEFLTGRVPTKRANRLVAIGRWDDPQKDASLLVAGIEGALKQRPDVEYVLLGGGGERVFAALCRRHPQVKYLGVRPTGAVVALLRESRALVFSSRWESGPIVAFEAVCSGASLVGPRWVPACPWLCEDRKFGTVFERRSGADLARAIVDELEAWDVGMRDPQLTADHFRHRFDPPAVCHAFFPAR